MISSQRFILWMFICYIAKLTRSFTPKRIINLPSSKYERFDYSRSTSSSSSSLNYSNNSNDNETPEDRSRRVQTIKQLQHLFYDGETGAVPHRHGTFIDLPLWRSEMTHLPSYQSVVTIRDTHYTHMFMKILSSPKPWYFGHLKLCDESESVESSSTSPTKPEQTGVLMQVTDYKQTFDGSLIMAIQGLEKFRVINDIHYRVPYCIAAVDLRPDDELLEANCQVASEAIEEMVSEESVGECSESLTVEEESSMIWGAARAAAVNEAFHLHPLEFQDISLREISRDDGGILLPIANFDLNKGSLVNDVPTLVKDAMQEFLVEPMPSTPLQQTENPLKIWGNTKSLSCSVGRQMERYVRELEYDVWVGIDAMFQLQKRVHDGKDIVIPVPTQLLKLLPTDPPHAWPNDFIIDKYMKVTADIEDALKATTSTTGNESGYRSPYIEPAASSTLPSSYPLLRRAYRLSYAVWALLESIQTGSFREDVRIVSNRQKLLELGSIGERLKLARKTLDDVNKQLRQVVYNLR